MPRARTSTATPVNPGVLDRERVPNLRSCTNWRIWLVLDGIPTAEVPGKRFHCCVVLVHSYPYLLSRMPSHLQKVTVLSLCSLFLAVSYTHLRAHETRHDL